MRCVFCSNINLDLLSTSEGYRHHPSCADLFQSSQNGCRSCRLIWGSQWSFYGGDLTQGYDLGPLDTQIIARVVWQKPGGFHSIRYGQEERWEYSKTQSSHKVPFLWTFLAIAAKPESPASQFLSSRVLLTRSLQDRLQLASKWLNSCLSTHHGCLCLPDHSFHAPTRVIDVGPPDGSQEPFLQASTAHVRNWITLSHCWGVIQPLKTTRESFSSHRKILQYNTLPTLFRDAVETVRIMGYRYLWIDSLCIIQDSKEDWQKEVSKMGEVYKNCVFMISAEFCHDHTESFFSLAAEKDYVVQGCHSPARGFCGSIYTYHTTNKDAERLARGVLQTRAWALQEDILSPRTMKWTQEQLVWECRTTTLSEEIPGLDALDAHGFMGHENLKAICLSKDILQNRKQRLEAVDTGWYHDPLVLWYRVVQIFCQRHISFSADVFPAISGIAKEVARHTGFEYRAGIWAQDFHNGLMWTTDGSQQKSKDYVGPTWTWASACNRGLKLPGALIASFSRQEDIINPTAEIIDIDIKYAGRDEFSAVTSGTLQIKGRHVALGNLAIGSIILSDSGKLEKFNDPPWVVTSLLKSRKGQVAYLWLDFMPLVKEHVLSNLSNEGAILFDIGTIGYRKRPEIGEKKISDMNNDELQASIIFYPAKNFALVLRPTGGNVDEYERIGIARVSGDLREGWESRLVTIV